MINNKDIQYSKSIKKNKIVIMIYGSVPTEDKGRLGVNKIWVGDIGYA